jgi:hypothetical protein
VKHNNQNKNENKKFIRHHTIKMDALPRELWDFILSFLHQPVPSAFIQLNTVVHDLNRWLGGGTKNEVARAALVCRELYAIVLANPHTHAVRPVFFYLCSYSFIYSFIHFSFY